MDRFWDAFNKSTIVSGLLALMVWGAIVTLAIMAREIPDILYFGGAAIIGFFFGSKTQAQATRVQTQILEPAEPICFPGHPGDTCDCPEDR